MRDLGTALLNELESIEKQVHLLLNQQVPHPNSIGFVEVSTEAIEYNLATVLTLIKVLYSQASQIDADYGETKLKGEAIVNTLILNLLTKLLFNLVLLSNKNLDIVIPLMDKVFNKNTSVTENIKATLKEVNKIEIA